MNHPMPMSLDRTGPSSRLYLPSLDGLRCVAFGLVLIHHLPHLVDNPVMSALHLKGWVGVEIFFVISSFLFFYLFQEEQRATGRIDASGFFIRRLLRLYPLMAAFPIAMLLAYGITDEKALPRLAGLLLFSDNMIAWLFGYNSAIRFSAHLWTLSFEFQVYLVIPVAFAAYRRLGRGRFTGLLLAVELLGLGLRTAFFALGASHPVIWVTPFLRPDSIILGILLSLYRPAWHWSLSAIAAVVLAAVFFATENPWLTQATNIAGYPVAAALGASLVDASMRSRPLQRLLGSPVLAYCGKISFGLYVFHFFAIYLAKLVLGALAGDEDHYPPLLVLSVAIAVLCASLSYFVFERPFLRLKSRFTKIDGRATIARAQSRQGL